MSVTLIHTLVDTTDECRVHWFIHWLTVQKGLSVTLV